MSQDRPTVTGHTHVTLSRGYSVVLPASDPPAGGLPVLLCLHAWGSTGDLLADRLRALEGAPYARLYPDAPYPLVVTEDAGRRVGASWYQYTGDQPAFMRELAFAERYLLDVLDGAARAHPIDPTRVVLMGYSQGGYLGAVAALRDRARYRGFAGVACRVKVEALAHEIAAARDYPMLLLHGARDDQTPLAAQQAAHDALVHAGVDATLHVHAGGHGLRSELVPMIDAFTRRVLALT